MGTLRKADLHLHTRHSGWQRIRLIDALDCYLDPVAVVEAALERGMDYAALTDHESIGGWVEVLARRPDLGRHLIPGVEVEAIFPRWGLRVHVNILGLDESQHAGIQRLRSDVYALLRYTRSQGLLTILNHPLRTLWRHPRLSRFLTEVPHLFDAYETLNSASPPAGNRAADELASRAPLPRVRVGGSDAHTFSRVARAYTVAPGETAAEFLESVRRGECAAAGSEPGLAAVAADVYTVVWEYYRSLCGPLFDGQKARRLRNILVSAALIPGALTMPTFFSLLNDAQYRGSARWLVRRSRELPAWSDLERGSPPEMVAIAAGMNAVQGSAAT